MCGIIGITNKDIDRIRSISGALAHRGPDANSFYANENISLGHYRLAIIDLSQSAGQPMQSQDGSKVISFNGEIYNFTELRGALEADGMTFQTNGDTEVILNGFIRHGTGIFKMLRGMWALAIYDGAKGTVTLSRDPFGIKPLYYSVSNGSLSFSSEVRALSKLIDKAEPDPDAYHQFFNLGYFIAPNTGYKDIFKLLPGETMVWDINDRKVILREINAPLDPISKNETSISTDLETDLSKELEDTVRAHFVSDVPVGLLFSGGNDSALLAALAKKLGYNPVAYHMRVKGSIDTEYARKIANTLNLDFKEYELTQEELRRQYERVWQIMDEVTADVSIIPTSLIFERIKGEAKVVLGGDGGDELFGGYSRSLLLSKHDAFRQQESVSDHMRKAIASHRSSISLFNPIINRLEKFLLGSGLSDDAISAYLRSVKIADIDFETGKLRESLYRLYKDSGLSMVMPPFLFFDLVAYLPNDLMVKTDTASMASSIEARVPFLDKKLFSFMSKNIYSKPANWKYLREKLMLKKELLKHIPKDLVERPKRGFGIPFSLYDDHFFLDDVYNAIAFHQENLDTFGLLNYKSLFDERSSRLIAKKYPRFAFALIANWKRFAFKQTLS